MRRECRERFPTIDFKRKPLVSDPNMHHGTCVTHVPWCMSGSLTRGRGENVPGIPGACWTLNFACLVRGPWTIIFIQVALDKDHYMVALSKIIMLWLGIHLPVQETRYVMQWCCIYLMLWQRKMLDSDISCFYYLCLGTGHGYLSNL